MLLPGGEQAHLKHPSPSCGIQRLPEVLALDAERVATWHASAQRIALVGALGTVIFQVLKDNQVEMSEAETCQLKGAILQDLDHASCLQAALAGICTSVHMVAADRGKWIAARKSKGIQGEPNACQARLSSALTSAADPKGALRTLLHKRVLQLVADALKDGLKPATEEDKGALADLRKAHAGGRRTGLCLMMLEIEELLHGATRASELHRAVHAPLIQGIISSYKPTAPEVVEEVTPQVLVKSLKAAKAHAERTRPATATTGQAKAVGEVAEAPAKDPSKMFWMAIG